MSDERQKLNELRLALGGSPITIFGVDGTGRFTWFENQQSVWASRDLTGEDLTTVFGTDDAARILGAASQMEIDAPTLELQVSTRHDGGGTKRTLKLLVQRPNESALSGRTAFLCSSYDMTEEVEGAERQRLLLLEVAHRSKNMLAMVLSIAAQTARSSETIQNFIQRFTGRIQSLAKSQDVITATDWKGVRFRELVEQQITKVVPMGRARIDVTGENPWLTPNAATHVGLALHELVATSIISGALAQPDRTVAINAAYCAAMDGHDLELTWCEIGPRVSPQRDDIDDRFSRSVLQRVVPAAVSGSSALTFEDGHLRYMLRVSAKDYRRGG